MPIIKKLVKPLVLFVLIASLLSGGVVVSASAPSLSAQSAILIDAKSGTVLFQKNADRPRPMASTTKIMTAVIAIESGRLDRTVKITKESVGIEGSSIYLCEGEILTLRQLLYALLLSSANDAATAIAIEVGGSIEGFTELMNKKAELLGLTNTHFDNPHGLDSDNHYTTASDLAALAAYAITLEEFRNIVSCYKHSIPMSGNENGRLLVNHNKLLKSYGGVIGVKTGFTKKSGRCLVSAAERNGTTLIAVTLSAPDDWRDHAAMLDYGFENFVSVPLSDGGIIFDIPVISGVSSTVGCASLKSAYALLPKDHGAIVCKVEADRFLYAPVDKGEKVGKITFVCDGKILGEIEITATEDVALCKQKVSLWDKIKNLFGS